jgi:predicted 2-oxoglutarate/Fe(II)-dependent dioxygenase YbiX
VSTIVSNGVLILPDFWSDAQCARVRSAIDRGRAASAEIYDNGYVVDEQVRQTYDVEVEPAIVGETEYALEGVRGDVSRFFGTMLTATEGPGFLRYPPGGFYRAHRDRLENPGDEFPRRISVVLFLSSAAAGPGDGRCEGGALRLYGVATPGDDEVPLDIAPAAGTLVAFPSDVLHEVLPVTAGVRDAIVDWFY